MRRILKPRRTGQSSVGGPEPVGAPVTEASEPGHAARGASTGSTRIDRALPGSGAEPAPGTTGAIAAKIAPTGVAEDPGDRRTRADTEASVDAEGGVSPGGAAGGASGQAGADHRPRTRSLVNPVLARELRVRMRGVRAALMLTGYLLVLVVVVFLAYQQKTTTSATFGTPAATETASVGRSIFQWVLFFLTLLVLFIVPALTAGTIAGERERQTLVPLQVSMLRPGAIVLGKLGAAIAFLVLLLVATLPLLTVAYVIGGVTIAQVLASVAAELGIGLILAALSVTCSASLRRTQTATVAAYGLVVLLTLGSFVVYAGGGIVDKARGHDPAHPPRAVLVVNPLMAVADIVADRRAGPLSPDSPDSPFNSFRNIGNKTGEKRLWPAAFPVLGTAAVISLLFASRRLRTPASSDR